MSEEFDKGGVMTKPKLLPCPWCHHKKPILNVLNKADGPFNYWIDCGRLFCSRGVEEKTKALAIKAWNTRGRKAQEKK